MQRVLSFQMARGFGESTEFVTKRMCFSFLFSVGFLSLLCGFLLGRFAVERAVAYRSEKKLLELAGNGLDSSEYLQHLLYAELKKTAFKLNFTKNFNNAELQPEDKHLLHDVLSNLSFVPQITEHKSCLTASVTGYREADRYVIVSASGQGISIALEIMKLLNKIHQDHEWKPRRTLIFCMFSGREDSCLMEFTPFLRRRIIAYIALHNHSLKYGDQVTALGSEIILSTVLNAARNTMERDDNKFTLSINHTADSAIDVPHVVFSLAVSDGSK